MSLRGYKPGELFHQTMLAGVTNPSRNTTECQEDSQGNSLAAGVEQVSDHIELTAESLNKVDCPIGRVVLDQRNKSKGKRKAANRSDSSAKKAHGRPKPLRYYSNTAKSTKPNANSTASTSRLICRACTLKFAGAWLQIFHTILGLNPDKILGKNSKIWTAKSTSLTEKG